jgi:hypothetical protein
MRRMVRKGCCSSVLHAPRLDLSGPYRIYDCVHVQQRAGARAATRLLAAIYLLPFAQFISPLLTPLSLRRPGLEIAQRSPVLSRFTGGPPLVPTPQARHPSHPFRMDNKTLGAGVRRPAPRARSRALARRCRSCAAATSAVARFRSESSRDDRHLSVSVQRPSGGTTAGRLWPLVLVLAPLTSRPPPTFIALGIDLSGLVADCPLRAPARRAPLH